METLSDKIPSGSIAPLEGGKRGGQPLRWLGVDGLYVLALLVSISTWFLAIASPLWLDETADYWIIHKGFWQIGPRLGPAASRIYPYILWFTTRLTGTSVLGLRIPSVLAMLGAAYVFYLCARQLFQRETAMVATIIFCVNPIVIVESIDVRPYAFTALTINATILLLLRLRKSDSLWLAGLFGLFSALITYFHFVAAIVLPALLLTFILWKHREGKVFWQQLGVGLLTYVVAFPPLIPPLEALFHHAGTHVHGSAPSPVELIQIYLPGLLRFMFALLAALMAAGLTVRTIPKPHIQRWQLPLSLSLGLIPVFTLFGISVATPIHMFWFQHLLFGVPGISLCWAFVLSLVPSRAVRLAFCLVLVGMTAGLSLSSPAAFQHFNSWKDALAVVERSASADNAPVLVCSNFEESNYVAMPLHSAKESRYFSQLAYYKLSVPVVPLPSGLNAEAKQVSTSFMKEATQKHERFFAMGYKHSYATLAWLKEQAAGTYSVQTLGVFDKVKVLEFQPKAMAVKKQ